jgi:hypothetical protein
MKQILTERQERWLQALESVEYEQTDGFLRDKDGFCCLGVACDVMDKNGWDGNPFRYRNRNMNLPKEVMNYFGFYSESGLIKEETAGGDEKTLSGMNDNGKTFKEIAAFVREFPEMVFRAVHKEKGDEDESK